MFSLKNIQTIIFDLGNVLLNTDLQLTINKFKNYALEGSYLKINKNVIDEEITMWNNQYEIGKLSSKQFRNLLRQKFNLQISDIEFDKCWNILLLTIPQQRIKLLQKLKKKYQIFLLSNTNEIHVQYFTKQDYWKKNLFDKVYYSHIVGIRKPDLEIYKKIITENNLIPNEILFFDDRIENINAAKSLGIKTVLIKDIPIEELISV